MRSWSTERLGAVAGVAFVVLAVIGAFAAGSPPKFDDPASEIVSFFRDNHDSVIFGAILMGIASPLFVWLVAAIALTLRAAGQTAWAGVAFAAGLVGIGLGTGADAIGGSLAQIAENGDNTLTQSLYQLQGFFISKAYFFAAVTALAVGVAAWRAALPRWYAALSLVAVVVFVLGGVSLKSSGFLAPLGAMQLIAYLGLLVWSLATATVLWMTAPVAEVTRATAPTPA